VPANLVINLYQTGLNTVPSGEWTMEREGSKTVGLAGLEDKRQITTTFATMLDGQFLPIQLLYKGKTNRYHPKFTFPRHWANGETCIRFKECILKPYVTRIREEMGSPDQPALLIMDKFRGQMNTEVQENLKESKILVVAGPSCTTEEGSAT
jgi:hypothetical protein